MFWANVTVSLVLGALGRRIAGGILNTWMGYDEFNKIHPGFNFRVMGDTPARLLYGFMGLVAALLGGAAWWLALLMIPAIWVGTTTGNGGGRDAGFGATSRLHDFLGMSLHAFMSAACPVLLLVAYAVWHPDASYLSWLWVFVLTMMAAPLYWLGWVIAIKLGGQEMPPKNDGGVGDGLLFPGLQGGAEWGEALWGGASILGIFLACHWLS